MTWEETIQLIRKDPGYSDLVAEAYFEEDLELNIKRFRSSEEYLETKELLKKYAPAAKDILDIGSGNGISAVSFALDGYTVTVSEPDPSETIGAGAIRILKDRFQLSGLTVHEAFAEDIRFEGQQFDVVYVRQAMHHAYDLDLFIKNLSGFIRPGGIIMTIRDHVIYDETDKEWFLENHPLHKFYGGENAFTASQYQYAFQHAGLQVLQMLKYYDSVINYFPLSENEYKNLCEKKKAALKKELQKKIGFLSGIPGIFSLYKKKLNFDEANCLDESKVPGRMYSFIAKKV